VPRRTHPLLLTAALAVGLLLALGVAACGGDGSRSAATLETPPLTVGTGVTLPSTTATTTTGTTSTTGDSNVDTGGAVDTGSDTGGAVDTGGDTAAGDTGDDPGGDTGGGTAPDAGGNTTTPAQPANPGGAAPDYQGFCDENQGAC
jgi:hypothetical protein